MINVKAAALVALLLLPARVLAQAPAEDEALRVQLELAQNLSWTPGKLAEAVAEYRKAESMAPESHRARLGLARVLAWNGQNEEAARRFDELLAENPDDVEALLGRAQVARWTGGLGEADRGLARAERLRGEDPRLAAERAQLDLALGRFSSARRAAGRARRLAPEAFETKEAQGAVDRALAGRFTVKTTFSEESTPFTRLTQIARAEFYPLGGLRLRPMAANARFAVPGDEVERRSAGLSARHALGLGVAVQAGYVYHTIRGVSGSDEVEAQLTGRPFYGPFSLSAGWRRRPIVDLPVTFEDIAYLEAAGSGGSTVASLRRGLNVREGFLSASVSPFSGAYSYVDAAGGRVNDGNDRRSVAAGLGWNAAGVMLDAGSPHSLTLTYDYYNLGYSRPSPDYFSPHALPIHTPGVSWRYIRPAFALGAHGGRQLRNRSNPGYATGAFLRVSLGPSFVVEARGQFMDTTAYRIMSATGGISVVF